MHECYSVRKLGPVLLASAWALAGTVSGRAQVASPGQPVAADSCIECHEDQGLSHGRGAHAGVNCASCHSGAAEHLADPGTETAPTKPAASACWTCHQSGARQMNWDSSDHALAAVQCRDCHGIHARKAVPDSRGGTLLKDPTATLCVSCHQEIQARLNMTSHHPINEGALSCTSCHNPHGSEATRLASETEICTACHQTVRGPHTFEHAPVVESCTGCHNPHGSPNRKLLQVAQPMLCLQCHSIADNRHGQTGTAGSRITGAALRSCTTCHGAMHGSSFDQHLRF